MTLANIAPKPWADVKVESIVSSSVLYLPIADDRVKQIPIRENHDPMVDLLMMNHQRIRPYSEIDPKHIDPYVGYSKIRRTCYEKLIAMLDYLPANVGIAYSEAWRPLAIQKKYFDKKFHEVLKEIPDKEAAYAEASKSVSPFINNVPPHATGAAFDITLFTVEGNKRILMDMGEYDTIYGPNTKQETFASDTTAVQRQNRLLLLRAAALVGFANYGFEWWHFSYGDRMWAYVYGKEAALYYLASGSDESILSIGKHHYMEEVKV